MNRLIKLHLYDVTLLVTKLDLKSIVAEFLFALRYKLGQYVDKAGDVVSHLNITNVAVEDGGLYTCRAINSLGSVEHSARLNVYGI